MGKSPKEWQVHQRRNGRLRRPSRPNRRFPALSSRKISRSKRWRLSHQSWAWVIVLVLAAGVWIDGPMTGKSPGQRTDRGEVACRAQEG